MLSQRKKEKQMHLPRPLHTQLAQPGLIAALPPTHPPGVVVPLCEFSCELGLRKNLGHSAWVSLIPHCENNGIDKAYA